MQGWIFISVIECSPSKKFDHFLGGEFLLLQTFVSELSWCDDSETKACRSIRKKYMIELFTPKAFNYS